MRRRFFAGDVQGSTSGPATSEQWRATGDRRKHASSQKNFDLWCATNLAHPKPEYRPKCDAKCGCALLHCGTVNNTMFGRQKFLSHIAQLHATMGGNARYRPKGIGE